MRLLRPGQWPKNLVTLLPLLDPSLIGSGTLRRAELALLAFILASAVVYVTNDIADRERDRAHLIKRERPIASGRIPVWAALATGVVLAGALAVVVGESPGQWWPVLTYLVVNVAYSLLLKHLPLIDLFTVASGFVLRLLQGYVAADAPPSGWLTLCVLSVCLLLILGKRRHELRVAGAAHRPSLTGYNEPLLEQLLGVTAACTFITYQLYATTISPTALLTAPFALFALFRYLQVVFVHVGGGGNPVRVLLRDRVMLANGALWLLLLEGGVLRG